MPSSHGYKRDYKQEAKTATQRGEDKDDAQRARARNAMEKAGRVRPGDGKDVDHKTPISRGGTNAPKNLTVQSKAANRSFKRNSDGSMK